MGKVGTDVYDISSYGSNILNRYVQETESGLIVNGRLESGQQVRINAVSMVAFEAILKEGKFDERVLKIVEGVESNTVRTKDGLSIYVGPK